MLQSSSNRGTPVSGENITRIVRQHYRPASPLPYKPEDVQCRTGTHCKINKPEDYWVENYRRRRHNLNKGFYTAPTDIFQPIGGELILDPYELIKSSLPGHVEKKFHPRMTRRGTIYESNTPTKSDHDESEKASSWTSDDLQDSCASAGFNSIKKLLRESRERIVNVRAGLPYEDHIKEVEEREKAALEASRPGLQEREKAALEASRPIDTGMYVHSISSLCLPVHSSPNSRLAGSRPGSARSRSPSLRSPRLSPTLRSMFSGSRKQKEKEEAQNEGFGQAFSNAETVKTNACSFLEKGRRKSMAVNRSKGAGASILKSASPQPKEEDNKLALIQCSSGITATLLRKDRQFKDHYLYLKMIYNILNALHNMKTKDIRSKVPLSKDLVERLQRDSQTQREDERAGSRGGHGCKWVTRRGGRTSNHSVRDVDDKFSELTYGYNDNSKMPAKDLPLFGNLSEEEDDSIDDFACCYNENSKKTPEVSPMKVQPSTTKKLDFLSAAIVAKKLAVSKFGRSTRASTVEMDHDDHRLSVFGTVKRANAMDAVGKSFFGRRRSRNATGLAVPDRPAVETWEDLLNVQPQEYREETPSFGFQVGIVSKFMRWYRRASVTPQHAGAMMPNADQNPLAHLSQIQEKPLPDQPRESNYGIGHQSVGSAQGHTEKAKKLPIWQQVAQEKSTVFHNKKSKAPNPDTAIQRFKRDLNKLKKSLQKENNAELEKLIRERMASFRLKFRMLKAEEASPLVEEQMYRIQEVCDKLNKSHLENFAVQPSKWYEELRDKSLSMISSFEQPDIEDVINKLQTFAHMDNKTVQFGKYIFESILLGAEAQFYEWLSHRKIPYMVVNETQVPKSSQSKDDQSDLTIYEPFRKQSI